MEQPKFKGTLKYHLVQDLVEREHSVQPHLKKLQQWRAVPETCIFAIFVLYSFQMQSQFNLGGRRM